MFRHGAGCFCVTNYRLGTSVLRCRFRSPGARRTLSLDAVTCVEGKRSQIRDLGIDDLLVILDEAEGWSTSKSTRSQA